MIDNVTFQPDWVSPPGETIKDILSENALNVADFAAMMDFSHKKTSDLLCGKLEIDNIIASKLQLMLGSSVDFWISRERKYRTGLERYSRSLEQQKQWLDKLPTREMVKYRWIKPSSKWKDKYRQCLDFFGVSSVDEWYEVNNERLLMTAFRTSSSFDNVSESVVTWLREGERQRAKINCSDWNLDKFQESLVKARALTVVKDPKVFIPALQELFAKSGVALVTVPTPSGCGASGATYFSREGYAIMMLSFRYLSDDQFWFTVFHEAAHLILHGDTGLFLEGVGADSEFEVEANNFSANFLVPECYQSELKSLSFKNWRQIPRLAKKVGVSPGIIVGQLQHLGILRHAQLNNFKVRYKWSSSEKRDII